MNRSLLDDCWVLRAPRLNANDDSVTLTRWLVPNRSVVAAGRPVAEIETEKATAELTAEISGLLLQVVANGAEVSVGAPLAYLGPDLDTLEAVRRAHAAPQPSALRGVPAATAKARRLAAARGIDLGAVRTSGDTIKERDVARHLAEREVGGEIDNDPRLEFVAGISAHQLRVARDLRAALQVGVFTTLGYQLDLSGPERMIAAELAEGRATSLLSVLLRALGTTLPIFPVLRSTLDRGKIYRYRTIDVAFAVRSPTGDLHAPVVRHIERLTLQEIARECARLGKSAMRGKLDAKDVGGACMTVSLITIPNVQSFVALPMPRQTAILALGARRQEIELTAAGPVARPVAALTITYNHAQCDGMTVAEFCAALERALNREPV